MLHIKNITYTYPHNPQPTLTNISFEVGQGEVCAILGKNGSGKTTLIKCIASILKPQEGSIVVNDDIGYVPQKTNLMSDTTILEFIVMGRYRYMGAFTMPEKKDYSIAAACAEELNISHLLSANFSQLSGGQQQLALIARALSSGSKCIVFDEPCSALDYGNQNHILKVIRSLKEKGVTCVFSTHDPNHVLHVANKVFILLQNREYLFGNAIELMTNEILSNLYQVPMLNIHRADNGKSVIPLFDQ